jgi:hypothetical protein
VEADQGCRATGTLLQQRLFPFTQCEQQVFFAICQSVEGQDVGLDTESVIEAQRHRDLAPDCYLALRC